MLNKSLQNSEISSIAKRPKTASFISTRKRAIKAHLIARSLFTIVFKDLHSLSSRVILLELGDLGLAPSGGVDHQAVVERGPRGAVVLVLETLLLLCSEGVTSREESY